MIPCKFCQEPREPHPAIHVCEDPLKRPWMGHLCEDCPPDEDSKKCWLCGEHYNLGPRHHACPKCMAVDNPPPWRDCHEGWTTWPNGEYAFWQHAGESERHQAILKIQHLHTRMLLEELPETIKKAREYQKVMNKPEAQRLRHALI